MPQIEFRVPLNKMNTIDRCKWFASQLRSCLPMEHPEVQAFVKAYSWLEHKKTGKAAWCYDRGFIKATALRFKFYGGQTEAEERAVLEDALAEMEKMYDE